MIFEITFFAFVASSGAFGKTANNQKSAKEKSLNHLGANVESEVITDDGKEIYANL